MKNSPRILALVVATALFMENMDGAIIATSLPTMAQDLGTTPVALKLAFTSYLLSLTIFLPISSWLADRFGAKNIFRIAIIVFTLASVLCGYATDLWGLVIARFLQGAGGAMMAPVGRMLLLRSVPKSELVGAMAWLTVPALIGPSIGPPIGGFITTYFSWHWIFWMHLPIGILGLIMSTIYLPDKRETNVPALDVFGFMVSGLGLSTTVGGLTLASSNAVQLSISLTMVGIGLFFVLIYIRHALRRDKPILDLRMLHVSTFRISIISGFFYRLSAGALPFLIPLVLQLSFMLTAFQSGLLTCASAIGAALVKFLTVPVLKKYGYRTTMLVNGVASCGLMAAIGFFTQSTPLVVIFGVIFFTGLLRSLQFTCLNSIAYADIESEDVGRSNGVYTVVQQLSMAMGVAVAAMVLDLSQMMHGGANLQQADYANAFFVIAAASLLGLPSILSLKPNAGSAVSGHHK